MGSKAGNTQHVDSRAGGAHSWHKGRGKTATSTNTGSRRSTRYGEQKVNKGSRGRGHRLGDKRSKIGRLLEGAINRRQWLFRWRVIIRSWNKLVSVSRETLANLKRKVDQHPIWQNRQASIDACAKGKTVEVGRQGKRMGGGGQERRRRGSRTRAGL